MEIAYAAYTESCVFMLDDEGICRWVVTRGSRASRSTIDNAQRCIGAQYVASLDFDAQGGLAALPKLGRSMLFAFVGTNGRIALVRSGAVVRFEDRRGSTSGAEGESAPTLPYEGDARASESGEYVTADGSLEIHVDVAPFEEQESTLPYPALPRRAPAPDRRVYTSPVDARKLTQRMTLQPGGPSAVPPPPSSATPPRRNHDIAQTGRYLPIQERALQHLARLKT